MGRIHLPEADRKIFELAVDQVFQLHGEWRTYQDIFSDDNIPLLNETTPAAWKMIEQSLRTSVCMNCCRLVDRDQMNFGGQTLDNLTLNRLKDAVKNLIPPVAVQRLHELLVDTNAAVIPLKALRNKAYGHNDLATALNPAHLLPKVNRDDISKAADLIGDFVNEVSNAIDDGGVYDFEKPFRGGDGMTLIGYVRRGNQGFDEDWEKKRRG